MQYYFSHDGQNQQGPIDAERLKEAGVGPETLVWRDGMNGWTKASDVAELAGLFAPAAQPQQAYSQQAYQPQPAPTPGVATPVNYQQPSGYVNQQPTNGLAIASMICGIVGLMSMCVYGFGAIGGILAIIFGHIARGQIRRGQGQGDGMAVAGLIMGYIAVGLVAVFVVIFVFIIIVAAAGSAAGGGRGGF